MIHRLTSSTCQDIDIDEQSPSLVALKTPWLALLHSPAVVNAPQLGCAPLSWPIKYDLNMNMNINP